ESSHRADLLSVNSGTSGWGGLQITNTAGEGIWSFMVDNTAAGIYDDQNNKWAVLAYENGETRLYYGGAEKLNTRSGGITITGDLTVTGGDIILNGTGRIQGIDTVSAGTDAANKTYVDNAVAGAGGSGTVTAVGVGVGLDVALPTTTPTITLDLSELTDMTATMVGTDEFIVLDGGAERRKAANEINLSIFNNDLSGPTGIDIDDTNHDVFIGEGEATGWTGNSTISIGHDNWGASPTAQWSVAIGFKACEDTTTGNGNTAIGYWTFRENTTGSYNTAIGFKALETSIDGTFSTAVGGQAMAGDDVSGNNTAIGYAAGQYAGVSSSGNVVVGANAGIYMSYSNSTSNDNVIIGADAARGSLSAPQDHLGDRNVIIGHDALRDGGNSVIECTIIGNSAGRGTVDGCGTNCTIIGNDALASSTSVSNEITLGNSAISALRCNVTSITSLSDQRDKSDIQDSNYGLNVIEKLRPVTFEWNQRDGKRVGVKEVGFIAQELQQVDDEYLGLVYDENPDKLEAAQGKLIPILVKSIQELKAEIESLKEEINTLKS
uniref:tail fiber domain-containing protein n=1 Tax=Vibrio sp. TaxID=678 RepID=UPI00311E0565